MKNKKEKAAAETQPNENVEGASAITTSAQLKTFLLSVRDKMTEEVAAPIRRRSLDQYRPSPGILWMPACGS